MTANIYDLILIFGGGLIALLLVLRNIYKNSKIVKEGDPLLDEDPVIRGGFSFLLIFFAPIGGAEIGTIIAMILHAYNIY